MQSIFCCNSFYSFVHGFGAFYTEKKLILVTIITFSYCSSLNSDTSKVGIPYQLPVERLDLLILSMNSDDIVMFLSNFYLKKFVFHKMLKIIWIWTFLIFDPNFILLGILIADDKQTTFQKIN